LDYLSQLGRIACTVIGPIVILVGAGYIFGRRLPAMAGIFAKVLLYLLIPVFVFQNIMSSSLSGGAYGTIILFSVLAPAILYLVARGVSAIRRHDRPMRGAFANTAILYNSANFAIPVMALAFSMTPEQETYAVAVQVVVAACQGLASYTVGAFLAAAGSGPVGHAVRQVFRLPFIYALVLAIVLQAMGVDASMFVRAGAPAADAGTLCAAGGLVLCALWKAVTIISQGYVPLALMTLGAQMACVRVIHAPLDVALSVALRLVVAPLLGLALVMAMGLSGPLAQILVIGVAGPTAIASAVVAIEFRNRPDFAASAVFLSTLGAGLTVPIVIFLVQTFL